MDTQKLIAGGDKMQYPAMLRSTISVKASTTKDAFEQWIYEACEIRASKGRLTAHDIYPYVDLTDAKLSYLQGDNAEEYSHQIFTN